MAGATIEIDTSEVQKLAVRVAEHLGKRFVLQHAVDLIQQSVKYNFTVGGRPEKWAPLKYRKGQPLRDTGRLMNSISGQVVGDKGLVTTNVVYAGTHNYGAKQGSYGTKSVKVKAHTRNGRHGKQSVRSHTRRQQLPWGPIPKREFMIAQDSDILKIENWLKSQAEK